MIGTMNLLQLAETDLRSARTLITQINDEGLVRMTAYHCQQCLEKSLKYIIKCKGNKPPHVHSMERLLFAAVDDFADELFESVTKDLDKWNTAPRYDEGVFELEVQDVLDTIDICDRLIIYIKEAYPMPASVHRINPAIGGSSVFNKKS